MGSLPKEASPPKVPRGILQRAACEAGPEPSSTDTVDCVFVWDLDETLILFHSLVSGDYHRAMGMPVEVSDPSKQGC